MPCGGDSSENCGGPDAIQVYVSESFAGSLGWNSVAVLRLCDACVLCRKTFIAAHISGDMHHANPLGGETTNSFNI